jgi:hypothetical protein
VFAHNNLAECDYNKLIHTCKSSAIPTHHECLDQPELKHLAAIIYASAKRLGVMNTDEINAVLLVIISSQFTYINASNVAKKPDAISAQFKVQLTRLVSLFKNCDADELLMYFLGKQDASKKSEIMAVLNQLLVWDSDLQDIPDWISIYQCLTNETLVKEYLDKLEADLQTFTATLTGEWQFPVNEKGNHELPINRQYPLLCYKLFSNFIYEWGKENGFQQSVKIVKSLDTKTFYRLLASQSLMKDSGIVADHGTFTHAVQWYIVVEHDKKSGFLMHAPLEIYQRLGNASLNHYSKNEEKKPWDLLFDSFTANFTSPEKLAESIKKDKSRWPLLAETFIRQAKKVDRNFNKKRLAEKHASEIKGGVVVRQFKSKL